MAKRKPVSTRMATRAIALSLAVLLLGAVIVGAILGSPY